MGRTLTEASCEVLLDMCRTYDLCKWCDFYGSDGCKIEFEEGYYLGDLLDMVDGSNE